MPQGVVVAVVPHFIQRPQGSPYLVAHMLQVPPRTFFLNSTQHAFQNVLQALGPHGFEVIRRPSAFQAINAGSEEKDCQEQYPRQYVVHSFIHSLKAVQQRHLIGSLLRACKFHDIDRRNVA